MDRVVLPGAAFPTRLTLCKTVFVGVSAGTREDMRSLLRRKPTRTRRELAQRARCLQDRSCFL